MDVTMVNYHPCVVCNKRKNDHPHLIFHAFPSNKERCQQWISAINMEHLHDKSTKYLNRCSKLCSLHFSTTNYMNPESSTLKKNAIPDQNLPEMDTGESKSTTDAQKTSPNKDGGKDIVEKQGNSSSDLESVSDSVDSRVATVSDSPSPNKERKGVVTRSVGKSPNKEVGSKKESVGKTSPTKNKASLFSDTTGDSPPPKRKKILDMQEEINFIELSFSNDELSLDDEDDSSSVDPLWIETESKKTIVEKPKALGTSVVQGDEKMKTYPSKKAGLPLSNEKTVAKGGNEEEINVLSSHKANCSPAKTSQSGEAIPESAKKYMILDKANIKEMMEKGLLQMIKKDGTNQTMATYRAVVPNGDSSILNKLASASVTSLPIACNTTPVSPSFIFSPTTTNSSDKVVFPSSGVKIHISPVTLANGKTSSVQQVSTSLMNVKTLVTSSASKQANMQVVALPPKILQQLQKKTSGESSATSGKPIKVITKGGTVATSVSRKYNTEDPDVPPSADISNDVEVERIVKQKKGAKYGVPTGISKTTKSVKTYEFMAKNKYTGVSAAGGAPVVSSTVPISLSTSNVSAGNSRAIIPGGVEMIRDDDFYTHKIQQLKVKHKEQLSYLRKRYSDLLHSYNELTNKYINVNDVGTMKQILTDAKKYMKKDHILFFRNEMILRERSNKGLRYSPKFMMMLLKYYKRCHIGYRFLKHIFTLPAARTLVNWRKKNLPLRKKKSASSGTMSSLRSGQHSEASLKSTGDDSDREAEDLEENSMETNSEEMDKTCVSDSE